MIAHVRLRLFSGWPNPEWTLDDSAARKLLSRFRALEVMPQRLPKPFARTGYRGFTLTLVTGEETPIVLHVYDQWVVNARMAIQLFDAKRDFEREIYHTAPPSVLETIHGLPFTQLIQHGNEARIAGLNPPDLPKASCANGPSPMSSKDWIGHAEHNNCYSYANDVLNTDEFADFALPGRLKKMPATTQTAAVRKTLRVALLADGLVRCTGDRVPAACPGSNKHYMAVVIRHHPGSTLVQDFHCLRLDIDGTWSHKDESGEPRNTDDGGKVITDLTQAVFEGTPTLVGVYRAKKDNPKIK